MGLFATLRLGDMLMMPTAFVGGAIVYPVLLFVMWWTMMMAMMLPSAAPAILTYGALSRKFAEKGARLRHSPCLSRAMPPSGPASAPPRLLCSSS